MEESKVVLTDLGSQTQIEGFNVSPLREFCMIGDALLGATRKFAKDGIISELTALAIEKQFDNAALEIANAFAKAGIDPREEKT